MNDIQIFNNPDFGDIRTVVIDGEPWFVSKDIAEKLGYAKTFSMTKQIDEEDKQIFDCSSQEDANFSTKARNVGIINESGLYSAIMGSQLKSAKAFKRWVTKDILPSIRKTGTYGQPQLPQSNMELLELHYQALKEVDSKVDDVSAELQTVKKELKEFKETLPLLPEDADEISDLVKKRGVEILGGKQSSAYNDRGLRMKLYVNFYSNLKYNFKVRTYKAIKRNQKAKAIDVIQKYEPPFFLAQLIEQYNAQQSLNLKGGATNE